MPLSIRFCGRSAESFTRQTSPTLTDRIFDGLYAFKKQALLLGREPS
jgi:hypothetical protein